MAMNTATNPSPESVIAAAAALLGVSISAKDDELRSAYLQLVRQHPPDREPDRFEQIRDSYELLRNPKVRASAVLYGPDAMAPLQSILDDLPPTRAYIGSQMWIQLLKEKRS